MCSTCDGFGGPSVLCVCGCARRGGDAPVCAGGQKRGERARRDGAGLGWAGLGRTGRVGRSRGDALLMLTAAVPDGQVRLAQRRSSLSAVLAACRAGPRCCSCLAPASWRQRLRGARGLACTACLPALAAGDGARRRGERSSMPALLGAACWCRCAAPSAGMRERRQQARQRASAEQSAGHDGAAASAGAGGSRAGASHRHRQAESCGGGRIRTLRTALAQQAACLLCRCENHAGAAAAAARRARVSHLARRCIWCLMPRRQRPRSAAVPAAAFAAARRDAGHRGRHWESARPPRATATAPSPERCCILAEPRLLLPCPSRRPSFHAYTESFRLSNRPQAELFAMHGMHGGVPAACPSCTAPVLIM